MISPERFTAIKAHQASMERAHRMTCSDPTDPARTTTYGDSAAAIGDLLAVVREQQDQLADAAADKHAAAPEGLEGVSVMAGVIAAHQYSQGDHGCSCEAMFYDTRRTHAQIMEEHILHVEMELLDARIGPVEEAKAQVLEEASVGLRGWYDERMNEEHAPDVVLTDHEQGREVGITEGILAASLKINPVIEVRPKKAEA